jgi:hypothetical protein
MLKYFVFLMTMMAGTVVPQSLPPRVSGMDQSPTNVSNYGKCTIAVEKFARDTSHWCKFNRLGSWPSFPNVQASRAFKFGRLTIYNGPIRKQKFACNVDGIGSDRYATVALSTKYLKTWEGGWNATGPGACGRCVCVSLFGGDDLYNRGLQKWVVTKYRGFSFMGRVGDRMGEGSDESIDILLDRPFSYAYVGPENPNAGTVNRLTGLRGFTQLSGPEMPVTVGTWTALWNFVPCDWTHDICSNWVKSFNYTTWTPRVTPGI